MYGDVISSVKCLSKTVRRFGSIIIGPEKFGSKLECRSLRSARIIASWTDNHGIISPNAVLWPGRVDCFIQHTLKVGSQSQQHVFALVDWYTEDESKDKYGKPVEVWEKAFLLGGYHGFFWCQELFPNLLLRLHPKTNCHCYFKSHVFLGQIVVSCN